MSTNSRRLRLAFNAPAILTFALLCLAAQLLNLLTKGRANLFVFSVYRSSLLDPMTYIRCLGHVFGHTDWEHLFGNLMYLMILGPMLEEKYGTSNMVFVILATALVTGVINMIFFPQIHLLGASGIVFAFILLASITANEARTIPLTFVLVAAMYMGQQIYQGIFVRDDVSQLTHILGGGVGSALGFVMNRLKMNRYQR